MSLSERDRQIIWYPYTQMKTAPLPIEIVRAEGALLYDADGKAYIDAIASWWLTTHGHAHPHIARRIAEQARLLEHVIFAGFTHQPAVELAERLLKILPQNQARIFFSDNGSTAVEVALKMAIQYWHNQGLNRRQIIAFENAYHGDTFGAMSVSGRGGFVAPFLPYLFDVKYIPAPIPGFEHKSLAALERQLGSDDVAAFIFEPLVQGAAGMLMHEPGPLNALLKLCKKNEVITIADEVMTGFGRTGKMFAVEHLTCKPDIMCLSKGLTGGTMPLAVTSCSEHIYRAFLSEDKFKTLFHGHSYTANPIGCAAALASLDLFDQPVAMQSIRRIAANHAKQLARFRDHPGVKEVRHRGVILAIEFETGEATSYFNSLRDQLYDFFMARSVLLRPLGNVIYILPPYCITDEQLRTVYGVIQEALDFAHSQRG